MKRLWQKFFGKKKRIGYNELSQDQRLWSTYSDGVLRPFGDNHGRGHIYLATPHSVSHIWRSKFTYENPIEAMLAADAHIHKMYRSLLAATDEEEHDFSFSRQMEREAAKRLSLDK